MPIRIIKASEPEDKSEVGRDIAMAIPTGLAEGVTGLVGSFGDLRSLGDSAVQKAGELMGFKGPAPKMTAPLPVEIVSRAGAKLMEKATGADPRISRLAMAMTSPAALMSAPTSRELLGAVSDDKPLYQPKTKPGKYARTLAQFAPAAATPGGPVRRAASVVVPGVASEAAGQATEGTAMEPYARIAAAMAGGTAVSMAGRGGPDTRLLAEASRGATDDQVAAARGLMEEAQRRGVQLTMAEALQQVTDAGTGMGRMQRVIEGTRAGNERIAPVMAQRPAQVRQAIGDFADTIAAPTDQPSMIGAQAQQAASGALDDTRQFINAWAKPYYDRLPGQSLPDEQFQQLQRNPSYQAALADVRNNPELAPLLQADLPMDEAARMARARQQGFTTPAYHGTPNAFADDIDLGRSGSNTDTHSKGAFFATDDPRVASTYAGRPDATVDDLQQHLDAYNRHLERIKSNNLGDAAYQSVLEERDAIAKEISANIAGNVGGNVRPLLLNPTGFLESDAGGRGWYDTVVPAKFRALSQGAPGEIIRNVVDPGGLAKRADQYPATTFVITDPQRAVRSRFDAFAPSNPDNDLNVINRVVQRLDEMQDAATPSPANPQGSNTLAAQRGKARSLAEAMASEVSDDWRAARDAVAGGRRAYLEPLQRGPLGAISKTPDLRTQTSTIFPAQPLEGGADEAARTLLMLEQQQPGLGASLTRQQLVNSANEATQDLQSGPNPWGGAKWAATQMGNPEQARTLSAGVGAVGGDPGSLDRLAEVLRATGKRQAPGSLTAYNAKDLEELGKAGVVGEGLRTGLNPPGIFRRLGQGFQDWQTERNAGRLAEAIIAAPADAERILLHARQVVPAGPELQAIERVALAAQLARQPQLEGR
jgi:hypothetical protein